MMNVVDARHLHPPGKAGATEPRRDRALHHSQEAGADPAEWRQRRLAVTGSTRRMRQEMPPGGSAHQAGQMLPELLALFDKSYDPLGE